MKHLMSLFCNSSVDMGKINAKY